MNQTALTLRWRSTLVLGLASLAGLIAFTWPLLLKVEPFAGASHAPDAPFLFFAILPIIVAVVLAELSEGGMDSKALAMLGVLAAVNAALRPLGAGIAGIELGFFMLILAGRVFGPGFGFVLGCTSLLASALVTAGMGPWLPFQMLCSGWIGMFAGLLPRSVSGRREIGMLVAYGVVAAYGFGFLMNLWYWPFVTGIEISDRAGGLGYIAGDGLFENLHRFVLYTLFSSAIAWDTGRAITNSVAIFILGPAILNTLRRTARRASFGSIPTFSDRAPNSN